MAQIVSRRFQNARILTLHSHYIFNFCYTTNIHLQPKTLSVGASKIFKYDSCTQKRFYRRSPSNLRDDEYYKILGIGRSATPSEIKKAYFAQAKKYHPDQNQGSDEAKKKFQNITEAYEVLGNVEKRQLYDKFGKSAFDGTGQHENPFGGGFGFGGDPFGGFSGMYGQRVEVDPQDIFGAFEQMFGSGSFNQRNRGPRKGQDLQIGLNISFLESVFGVKKDVNVTYKAKGSKSRKTKQVSVEIPPGVQDGMAIQIKGEGGDGDKGAPMGDLIVQISVADDPYFKRDGIDLHVETTITVAQAILGSKVDVLTLNGMVEVTIPPGTSPDTVLLMRQKGVKRVQGFGKGDQYVHVKIDIPKPNQLNKDQLHLVEELRRLETNEKKPKGAFARFSEKIQSALSRLTQHSDKKENEPKPASEENSESKNKKAEDSSKHNLGEKETNHLIEAAEIS